MLYTKQSLWGSSTHELEKGCCCSGFLYGVVGAVFFCAFLGQSPVYAKDTASEHQETSTRFTRSTNLLTDWQRAKLWGLDKDEWLEYKRLMQGPRGLWTPNLDPVQVLGMNAETSVEMRHYAKKMAKMEYARLTREGAFDRAYASEYKKILGDQSLFPVNQYREHTNKETATSSIQRIQFYVKLPCDECLPQMKKWLADSVAIDIHFLDSKNADIKLWAVKMGISPLLVSSKQITLNHISKAQVHALGVMIFPSWRKK